MNKSNVLKLKPWDKVFIVNNDEHKRTRITQRVNYFVVPVTLTDSAPQPYDKEQIVKNECSVHFLHEMARSNCAMSFLFTSKHRAIKLANRLNTDG